LLQPAAARHLDRTWSPSLGRERPLAGQIHFEFGVHGRIVHDFVLTVKQRAVVTVNGTTEER
jgi:hypothetical protein